MTLANQLVFRLFQIAESIAAIDGPRVSLNYCSLTHQLSITAHQAWSETPHIDECIELIRDRDAEFTRLRIERRLLDAVKKLSALAQTAPRPAA